LSNIGTDVNVLTSDLLRFELMSHSEHDILCDE